MKGDGIKWSETVVEYGDLRLRRQNINMTLIRSRGDVKGSAVDSIVRASMALATNIANIVDATEDGGLEVLGGTAQCGPASWDHTICVSGGCLGVVYTFQTSKSAG